MRYKLSTFVTTLAAGGLLTVSAALSAAGYAPGSATATTTTAQTTGAAATSGAGAQAQGSSSSTCRAQFPC
jgi:hypothetical protein